MAHLIDKDALVAEIERLKDKEIGIGLNAYDMGEENGKAEMCNKFLSFLDTLEVKEVDMEKEIGFYIETSLTGANPIYTKGAVSCIIEKTAKHFFELGLKAQKL